ncbi:MAG: winged helix-turn-helix transcriptional regulator [Thermoplasmata archaeon]|nr:winged helix-turn-helix transcriptional regulator [Thermoplasmata archaeon]
MDHPLMDSYLKALSNEKRRKIVELLLHEPLSFKELMDRTGMPQSTLADHLDVLQRSALVYNYVDPKKGNRYRSYYKLSDLGEKFVTTLYSFFFPPRETELVYLTPKERIIKNTYY